MNPIDALKEDDIQFDAIRSRGAGGQHVNKASTAIHLRFDISRSSLPDHVKEKLLILKDRRITADGMIIIKAKRFRSQKKNREDALNRLKSMILLAAKKDKKRIPSKPSKASQRKRLEKKARHAALKRSRAKYFKD